MEIITSKLIEINYYSEIALFEILKEQRIAVYDFRIIRPYVYRFRINGNKNYQAFKSKFKSFRVIEDKGLIPFFYKQTFKRITILATVLSLLLFMFCSTLLMQINVRGTNDLLNEKIEEFLCEKNIKKYKIKPKSDDLKKIRDEYFLANLDTYESLEFILNGNVLYVDYTLKKQEIDLEKKHGKMYASKDAIIDLIEISSGNVLVKESEYVYRGQLLVDDCFYYKEDPICVGTSGKIYAYTYETVTVSVFYLGDKEEQFAYLIDEARREVAIEFNDKERIVKENINDFYSYQNYVYLKVSYTLYENIVIF